MNAWLAIDSGGSKSHLMITDEEGMPIQDCFCPGIGLAVDDESAPLPELMAQVRQLTKGLCITRIAANLGGKNENQLRKQLAGMFPEIPVDIFRESSGVLANQLGKKYHANAVVLLGTGVIVNTRGPRGCMITDGWGSNIGDMGSGYWIGLEAIRRSLISLEDEPPLSLLAQAVTGRKTPLCPSSLGGHLMAERDAVRGYIGVPLDRAKTAAYARVAAQYAQDGDKMARKIFSDAGNAIAETTVRGLKKAGIKEHASVLVVGGLTNVRNLWEEAFANALIQSYPDAVYRIEKIDLIQGAVEYMLSAHHMEERKND
ncbi:MAG: hypothetical protein E7329_08365 [Clostridiales bacterium]|nr:hypothetical protein [Clostridiales bacterium]